MDVNTYTQSTNFIKKSTLILETNYLNFKFIYNI